MMKTILIDDEPLASAMLKELLQKEKDIEIIATCRDGFEGLKAIQELNPDLIFLDIQMPKITGFEMLELIEKPPLVIFTTAFDEYAIKAFDVNALDYLLKPIHPERLEKALQKIRNARNIDAIEATKPKHYATAEQLQRMVVKTNGKIKIIPLEEIYYIESADDYIKINTGEQYFLKHQTMLSCEQQLPANQFIRIHRSFIVNIAHLHKIELYEKDQYRAVLRNDAQLSISRSGYALLKKVLHL